MRALLLVFLLLVASAVATPADGEREAEKRGTRAYVYLELDWDFARWTVGFMGRPGGTYRAVSIATVHLVALVEVRAPLFYRGWPVKLYPCPFDC